jgi:hypothetical protein
LFKQFEPLNQLTRCAELVLSAIEGFKPAFVLVRVAGGGMKSPPPDSIRGRRLELSIKRFERLKRLNA